MSEPRTGAAKDADYKHAYIVGRNRCKCGKEFVGEWKGYAFHLEDVLTAVAAEREAATPPLDVDEVIDALDAQAQLLACYRVGKHPSGMLLDRVGRANDLRARLAQQDGTGETRA